MPPEDSGLHAALALMLTAWAGKMAFERLTGMTLDQWDEMNYQRVMANAGG